MGAYALFRVRMDNLLLTQSKRKIFCAIQVSGFFSTNSTTFCRGVGSVHFCNYPKKQDLRRVFKRHGERFFKWRHINRLGFIIPSYIQHQYCHPANHFELEGHYLCSRSWGRCALQFHRLLLLSIWIDFWYTLRPIFEQKENNQGYFEQSFRDSSARRVGCHYGS